MAGEGRTPLVGTGLPTERPSGHTVSAEQARPFVGRTRELDEVLSALPAASTGHGSLFLISGEPGIGKSRLMGTVGEHAEERGWRVLTGRCWDGGGAPAYWPWIQIVRGAGGDFAELAPVPEAADSASGRGRRSPASESVDPEAARFQLFDEVGRFLSDSAHERPTLIVLDDLHAADEPSLLLLRFLATTVPERPIVALGSYREGEVRVRELADVFGDLARLGRRIPLRGLSTTEVARYIALASGDEPSDAVATRVSDVTGGNPFFIGEVVRVLVAEGRLATADEAAALPLPEEVRALIRRRLAGLSPEAVNLLRVAAVIGRDFDLRVIAPTTTLSPERIIDVLAESERAGVIAEDRNQPGTYAFAHDLVRETLYEDLPATRRMELHRTVGGELEQLFRDDLEPHLAEIAHISPRRHRSEKPSGQSITRCGRPIEPSRCWPTRTPPGFTSERYSCWNRRKRHRGGMRTSSCDWATSIRGRATPRTPDRASSRRRPSPGGRAITRR